MKSIYEVSLCVYHVYVTLQYFIVLPVYNSFMFYTVLYIMNYRKKESKYERHNHVTDMLQNVTIYHIRAILVKYPA